MASPEIILRVIMSSLTALENGFICLLVVGNKRLRTPTNGFIASLALSDFLNGALLIPLHLTKPSSEALGYIVAVILLSGVASVSAVTYDRYTAVAKPFLYRHLVRKNFIRIIVAIWAGTLIVALLPLLWKNNPALTIHTVYMFFLCAAVILPYCVIVAAYYVTFKELKKHFKCLRDIRAQRLTNDMSCQVTSEKKVVWLMCAVAVLFILCWIPTLYITMAHTLQRVDLIPQVLDSIALFGIQLLSLLNPLLYVSKKDDFHSEVRSLFYKCTISSGNHRIDPVNLTNFTRPAHNVASLHQSVQDHDVSRSPSIGERNLGFWL